MNDRQLYELQLPGLRRFYGVTARSSNSGRTLQLDGVQAAIVPAAPHRSVCNGVIYESVAALEAAMDQLATEYAQAGVLAWTVWVPEGDREARNLLEASGHVLDATPMAMGMELAGFRSQTAKGVVIESSIDGATLGAINDLAYDHTEHEFEHAFEQAPEDLYTYGALIDGTTVACAATLDNERDCTVTWVATLPEARGKGLATALMARALDDARSRGCETASLQSSKAGHSVYLELGFRDLGELQMWERRQR